MGGLRIFLDLPSSVKIGNDLKLSIQVVGEQTTFNLECPLSTVKAHVRTLFQKLGVSTRTEVGLQAVRRGLLATPNNPSANSKA